MVFGEPVVSEPLTIAHADPPIVIERVLTVEPKLVPASWMICDPGPVVGVMEVTFGGKKTSKVMLLAKGAE